MANVVLNDYSTMYISTRYRPSATFVGFGEKVIELAVLGSTSYTKIIGGVFPQIGDRPYLADVGFARLFPGGGVLLGGSVVSPLASVSGAFVMLLNETTGDPVRKSAFSFCGVETDRSGSFFWCEWNGLLWSWLRQRCCFPIIFHSVVEKILERRCVCHFGLVQPYFIQWSS